MPVPHSYRYRIGTPSFDALASLSSLRAAASLSDANRRTTLLKPACCEPASTIRPRQHLRENSATDFITIGLFSP
eukprot:scaffold5174_cov118-Isochrysis_galbana.AAC.8